MLRLPIGRRASDQKTGYGMTSELAGLCLVRACLSYIGGVQSLWKSDIVTGDFKMFYGSFGDVSGPTENVKYQLVLPLLYEIKTS